MEKILEMVNLFIEDKKNKYLNNIEKLSKNYEWYLGLIFHSYITFNEDKFKEMEAKITKKCNIIYEKSEKNVKLIKICLLDDDILLLFALNSEPYNNDIKKIVKSICRYLDCEPLHFKYIRNFYDTIFSVWNEQNYQYLIYNGIAHDLRELKNTK